MPQPPMPLSEWRRRWDAYTANGRNNARAAQALNLNPNTLASSLHTFRTLLAGQGKDEPDDAFWQSLDVAAVPVEPAPAVSPDALEIARLRQQVKRLTVERDQFLKQAVAAEDLRGAVFGLAEPIEPVRFDAPVPGKEAGETIVVMLSDLHWGEVISGAAMDGINSYDLDIARARLKRCFAAIVDLATRHWPGKPPERVILILGGDMVSGNIHMELEKTNSAAAIPAVRDLVGHIAGGIRLLLDTLACPVDVISIPGNHGRTTIKPESKADAENSYDTLVSDFLEMQFAGEERLTFYVPASGDALFSVYGWQILATHGDRIGSRGGQGFVGPAATVARGFKKLAAEYAARGTILDLILVGHFHVALMLEEGFANGSLPGPSEYGRDFRFRPRPATQLYFTMHPKRGVTQVRWLQVGDPSEGSIYAPRASAVTSRPKYRIPAVGRAA